MRTLVIALACLILLPMPGEAATLAGVSLPDTITVGPQTLVLNGLGLRTKLFVKVYVGGLYVERKSADPAAIIRADATKRVVMEFLYGQVSRDQMVEAFTDGFRDNAPSVLQSQRDQFLNALETMKKGEHLVVTYVPGTGTTLSLRGKDKLTIAGLPFAQALFAVWLGPKPPTADLKAGMLGQK